MQPHIHIYKQNNNQNFAFYCIKHSKIDAICKKNANIYCKLFVITQQK